MLVKYIQENIQNHFLTFLPKKIQPNCYWISKEFARKEGALLLASFREWCDLHHRRICCQSCCIIKHCLYLGSWQSKHKIPLQPTSGSSPKSDGPAGRRNKTISQILEKWQRLPGRQRSAWTTVMDVVQAINLLGEVRLGKAARAPAYLLFRK